MAGFISDQGLAQLKEYKYVSGGYSWLDNKINVFWVWCVELVPLTVAPNLLTFIGFVFMIASCSVQIAYDMTLMQVIPRWPFLFSAISIFVYQTLDAIDGKQARRTQTSSPLGQLFDHGCDSFVMTFFQLQAAQAAQIHKEYLFYVFFALQLVLWAVNQKEHYTGVMHTHVGNVGVTEMELVCMTIQLITFFFGQEVWNANLESLLPTIVVKSLGEIPFIRDIIYGPRYLLVVFNIIGLGTLAGIQIFLTTLLQSKHKFRTAAEWFQLIIFWGCQFIWFKLPIYGPYAGPILIMFGILLSLAVCKIIICSTTKDTPRLFHTELIPFEIVTFILYMFQIDEKYMVVLLWFTFAASLILTLSFLAGVINQITDYLQINCFTIKKKK